MVSWSVPMAGVPVGFVSGGRGEPRLERTRGGRLKWIFPTCSLCPDLPWTEPLMVPV